MKIRIDHEKLNQIVKESYSIADVLRRLDMNVVSGTNYRIIRDHIKYFGISTEHFTGQGWSRGKTAANHKSVDRVKLFNRIPNERVFVRDSSYTNSSNLFKRLLELGWEEKCSACGIGPVWNNKRLRLQLDHINGDKLDHRFLNLRFLCPNCHTQTDTFCSKNRFYKSKDI